MSQDKFRVIFKGELSEGASPDDVKPKLAKILKLSDEKADKLLSGKAIVIKKNASQDVCKKIQAALKKAGAECKIKKEVPPKDAELEITTDDQEGSEFKVDGFKPSGAIKLEKPPVELPGKPAKKSTVILLSLFFGVFGMHKFYTSRNIMGYIYVLLSWTLIPIVFSMLDILVYLLIKKEKFEKKFRVLGKQKHMILGLLLSICLIGTEVYLAITIGIPMYIEYRDRSYHIAVDHELNNFRVMQEVYYIDNKRYAPSLNALEYEPRYPIIKMKLVEATSTCYKAEGKHPKLNYARTIDCNGKIEDGFKVIDFDE